MSDSGELDTRDQQTGLSTGGICKRFLEWWKKRKQRREESMKQKYGCCRVDGCDEWLLPVTSDSGKCPVHIGVQNRSVNTEAVNR